MNQLFVAGYSALSSVSGRVNQKVKTIVTSWRLTVCTPRIDMELLENRISFDASFGDLLFHDALPSLADIPHAPPSDHHVVLITDTVAATDGVRQAIPKDSQIIVVDSHQDNLKTINEKITQQVQADGRKVGSLAVLAHAEKGKVILGTDKIDLANVQEFKPQLEELGKNLADRGQIQLFGCSVAEDVYGQGLVEVISVATHTDVFASTNATGHGPEKDWTLEYSTNPQTQMKTAVDAEQLAALPLDLGAGDLVVTKGTVGPITEVVAPTLVNLNSGFVVKNADGTDSNIYTKVTLLANPDPTTSDLWSSIKVKSDPTFLASLVSLGGPVPTVTPVGGIGTQIEINNATAVQATAILGTLEGTLNAHVYGNAQILIYAQNAWASAADGAVDTLNVGVHSLETGSGVVTVYPTPSETEPSFSVPVNLTSHITGLRIDDSVPVPTPTESNPEANYFTVTVAVNHGKLTTMEAQTTITKSDVGTLIEQQTTFVKVGPESQLSFRGPLQNVNTSMAGLMYTPDSKYRGETPPPYPDTLYVFVSDPTSNTASSEYLIEITNAKPTVATPVTSVDAKVGVPIPITGVTVGDEDIGTTNITASLSVSYGTLSVPSSANVTGNGTNSLIINDTLSNVNALLAQLRYTGLYKETDTLSITVNDQTTPVPEISDTGSVTIIVDAPTPSAMDLIVHVPAEQTVYGNVRTAIEGIYLEESGYTGEFTVILSVSHGTVTVQVPATPPGTTPTTYTNSIVKFTDTLTNVNTALAGLIYTPTPGYTGIHEERLIITAVDQTAPTPGTDTQTIVINVQDPLVAAPEVTVPGAQTVNANSRASISGISVLDADVGTTGQLTVTLKVLHGTITVQVPATTPGSTPVTYTNPIVTFTDTLANVNTALAGLIYTPTDKYDSTDTLTITAEDQSPSPLSDTKTVDITVANVAPTVSPHAAVSATAGKPISISGITVTDPDIGTTNMAVTLTVSHGVLNVPPSGCVTGNCITGNDTNTLTIIDTLTNVNALISALQYNPAATYSGAETLTITANDQSTPTPGIGTTTVSIDVAANPYPQITVPGAVTVSENLSTPITGLSITDENLSPTDRVTVALSVGHGTLKVYVKETTVTIVNTLPVTNTTMVQKTGSSISFGDTLAWVNSSLAGLTYTPDEKYEGTDTLTVTASDPYSNPVSGTVAITVTNVDPIITAPATLTVTTGTSTTITGIDIADPDIGSTKMAVTLTVSHGVLNVPSSTSVTGNGTNTLIINDNLANVNTQLSGLQYTPTVTYTGSDTLTIYASDQSTPTPGTDTSTTAITVNAIAYSAPVVTVPGAQTVTENSPAAITGISVYDADIGATGQLTVTLRVSHGTITVQVPATTPGTTPVTYTNSIVTFTDTLTNVNTALAGLIYKPTDKYDSTDTLTITAEDQSPSPLSDTKTIAITVTNADPTITAPATATAVTYTSTAITGISIADPDIAATNMSVTLSVGYGVLNVPSSTNVTGNGTSTVIITDSLATVNSQLSGLRYTSNSGFTGIDTLSITANDLSTPTAGTDSDQVAITVTTAPTPVASPPTINAPSVLSVNEDTALPIQFGPSNPISVQYADTTQELRVTLTANNGYITLGWKGHLNSYVGDGTLKVNFTGPLAAINEALYGLKYAPVHDYFDTTDDTMTIRVDDQAGQITTQTMAINVYSVNDPPVVTVPGVQSLAVNTPKVISGVSVADPDIGVGSMKMTLGALHGSLSVTGVGPSADITFTNTLANVNTLLGTLTYSPISGYWGPDWITVTANDQGNSGAGGAMSDTKKVTLRVGTY